MVFSSLLFLFFFLPPLLMVYYFANDTMKNVLLIVFSLFFYAWGEPVFVILMIFATSFDYTTGRLIGREYKRGGKKAKLFLLASIIMNLGLLSFFKYADFLISTVNAVFGISLPLTNLPLPIGISFYTFQTMSYTIDVYRKKVEPQKSYFNFLFFTSLFPQLIAGPIVRYADIEKQLLHRKITLNSFSDGVIRFCIGLGKKILIANRLALIADSIFNQPAKNLAVGTAWIGIVAYTAQIYFDFSGYSDMAIALGKMLGFVFPENFNYPYISCSVTEFWRRWHISLSSWFRDYVYFPLGGSRVDSKFKLLRNLFIVWFLTGLWHGAAWNFALWGLYYFIFLAIEKLTRIGKVPRYSLLRNLITMLIVMLGWVFFRSENASYALHYIKVLFGFGTSLTDSDTIFFFYNNIPYFLLAFAASLPILPKLKEIYQKQRSTLVQTILGLGQLAAVISIFILSVINLVNESYNPFIYFRF